jgi:hypothetical protein
MNISRPLVATLLLLLTAVPAAGQGQDTICAPVQHVEALRQEVQILRHRDSTQQEIIANLRRQRAALERIQRNDSTIVNTLEERLRVRDERLRWKREQVEYWREQAEVASRRKWLWAGGAGIVVLLGALAGS